MNHEPTTIGWRAPSNIALVKYWGKRGLQLPENGSLSITLEQSATTTFLSYRGKSGREHAIHAEYYFHGDRHPQFEQKVVTLLNKLMAEMPFLSGYELLLRSENNFPHSTGIASSASSMAALALCLVSMEEQVTGRKMGKETYFRRASTIARLGSGSASRSVYGGVVTWGKIQSVTGSSDEYAAPFPLDEGSRFHQLRDIILIVSTKEKKISSSSGHVLMANHPYHEGRKRQANENMESLTKAIRDNDYKTIAAIAENEALSLHALLISSRHGEILLEPNTLLIIEAIRRFRSQSGIDLFFTIDAGPNVHLIYFEDQREEVRFFVRQNLEQYCENGHWIDDRIGAGPLQINMETRN
jgi:diphosphomevalonate decarboxylase